MAQKIFRTALAQINPTVGDLAGNQKKILDALHLAAGNECDLVAFPELGITGYPPEDLLLRRQFIHDQREAVREIAAQVGDLLCVIGCIDEVQGKLFNASTVLHRGARIASYHKVHLPNYSVFDEERYFEAGRQPLILDLGAVRIGLSICEDIWIAGSVVDSEALNGQADILLNISASPYHIGKSEGRLQLMRERALRTHSAVAYVNLVGGQDELVFDGQSLVLSADGRLLAAGDAFAEDFIVVDWPLAEIAAARPGRAALGQGAAAALQPVQVIAVDFPFTDKKTAAFNPRTAAPILHDFEEIYQALLLGIRDYVAKNGFEKVVLGSSGGIDSALVAVLAVDALGAAQVKTVAMPSPFSSAGSVADARQLAQNLGIELIEYPIHAALAAYEETLAQTFAGLPRDITEENLQARIRGNLLMALSNKFGWMVLVTGNKSEVSVGYCTIYGDMAGGFSPLKDVFKTMVYELCDYRNKKAGYDLIPRAIITKAPSAELRPNQTDQDSLPPYDVLDAILECYVEREMGVAEIAARGFDPGVVRQVARLVDMAEYKRRQAAPGIKITPRAFGKDRRMPITNRYRSI